MAAWTFKLASTGFFDLLHWRKPAPVRTAPALLTPPIASREVSERRAEAMRGFFPKLSAWLGRQSYLLEMREVDRYLSQSSDIFDLERRIRRIEREGSASRWF